LFDADYEKMFENHIFSVVERFYENVSWSAQRPGSLVQANLFELFA
jgi:hypothetical protein